MEELTLWGLRGEKGWYVLSVLIQRRPCLYENPAAHALVLANLIILPDLSMKNCSFNFLCCNFMSVCSAPKNWTVFFLCKKLNRFYHVFPIRDLDLLQFQEVSELLKLRAQGLMIVFLFCPFSFILCTLFLSLCSQFHYFHFLMVFDVYYRFLVSS